MKLSNHKEEQCRLPVIDDIEEILKSIKRHYRKRYQIHASTCAESGFDILKQHQIRVLLSDQRMPGMTGKAILSGVKFEFPDVVRMSSACSA